VSTLKVDTITKADGTGSLSVPAESGTVVTTASPSLGRRNLIINGAMQVAQRGTSAFTINDTGVTYTVDRFAGRGVASAGVFTLAQDAEAPTGFDKSLKATVTTADASLSGSDSYRIVHHLEGLNAIPLSWGTADAKTVTLSFKVRSSVTGTFGGAIQNGNYNRFYPFSYAINEANTWTDVAVTIAGDISGTWPTTNALNMRIVFSLGTALKGTVNNWGSSVYEGASGQTDLISTNGATFYITGAQLEVGSVATPFEHRSYGEELALCQRYYQRYGGASATVLDGGYGTSANPTYVGKIIPVTMRAAPTITKNGTWSSGNATVSFVYISNNYFTLTASHSSTAYWLHHANSTDDYLELNAEL
jgi:hypothetical protein